MKAVVTVVTFNNAPTQLDLYARALRRAIEQARGVADASLLYLDNGGASRLDARVAGARMLPSAGNVGYGPALHRLLEQAMGMEKAGAFSLVLEGIPTDLGREITDALEIPTIGIGAGPHCDGQVLVTTVLLGMNSGHYPKFA